MSEPTAIEVLAVAKVLATKGPGWCKGVDFDHITGKCCAQGLLHLAVGESGVFGGFTADESALYTSAWTLLQDALPKGHYTVTGYNDADKTTRKDVLRWFDRAIRKAQAGA